MISQHLPASGSLAFGLELAGAGWVFAAVGGVAAQLTESAGSARGIAGSVLGGAYLLRVVGDLSGRSGGSLSWLSWLSPIGWAHRVRPYGGERWWLLALGAGLTAALAAAAVALSARRDVGAGLLPGRPGPAAAAPGLRSPLALAWRLHRGLLTGWTAGFAVLGVVFGGLANGIGEIEHDNPTLQDIFARMGGRAGLPDAYLAGIMGILGLIAAAYAIQATLKLRSEGSGEPQGPEGSGEPRGGAPVGRVPVGRTPVGLPRLELPPECKQAYSRNVRGRPKCPSTLLSRKRVRAEIRSPATVITRSPCARAMGVYAS